MAIGSKSSSLNLSDVQRQYDEMTRRIIQQEQRMMEQQVNAGMWMPSMMREPWFGYDPAADPDMQVARVAAPLTEPDRKAIPREGVALADDTDADAVLAKEAEQLLGYSLLSRKLKIPGKLGEVLHMLDIEPLDTTKVEEYKTAMILFRKAENSRREPNRMFSVSVSWQRKDLRTCNVAGTEIPTFVLRKAIQVKRGCPEVILEVDELIEEKKLIDPFLVARLDDEVYYLEVWKEPKFEETL